MELQLEESNITLKLQSEMCQRRRDVGQDGYGSGPDGSFESSVIGMVLGIDDDANMESE